MARTLVKWDNPRYFSLAGKPEQVFVVVCERAYRCRIGGKPARPLTMQYAVDQGYYFIYSGLPGTLVVYPSTADNASTWNGIELIEHDAAEFKLTAKKLASRKLKDACQVHRIE